MDQKTEIEYLNLQKPEIPHEIQSILNQSWDEIMLKPKFTNISSRELKENFKGVRKTFGNEYYFFFSPLEDTVDIQLLETGGGYIPSLHPAKLANMSYIPLKPLLYGKDVLIPINAEPISVNLNQSSQDKYHQLTKMRQIAFPELLETVGYIINRSLKYVFDPAKTPVIRADELISLVNNEYKPVGDETIEGVCADAGVLIRKVLASLHLPDTVKYMGIGKSGQFRHDTTLIFDKVSGIWGFINSKSPSKIKQFNFAATEGQREVLGLPF